MCIKSGVTTSFLRWCHRNAWSLHKNASKPLFLFPLRHIFLLPHQTCSRLESSGCHQGLSKNQPVNGMDQSAVMKTDWLIMHPLSQNNNNNNNNMWAKRRLVLSVTLTSSTSLAQLMTCWKVGSFVMSYTRIMPYRWNSKQKRDKGSRDKKVIQCRSM